MTRNTPEHVVVLIHGIRCHASWAEMVAQVLKAGAGVKVNPIRFGYFELFRFLCPLLTRRGPVNRIIRELQDLRAENPESKLSVIAHSFGTYGIVQALKIDPNIRLHRVILCGSVVKNSFRRARFRAQIDGDDILNECGSQDVWPPLAQSVTWGYGATGTFGFGTSGVRDRYHKCGHSDYFKREFVQEWWLPFIDAGEIRPTGWESERPPTPYWISLLAWFPIRWIIALLLLVLFALIAWWVLSSQAVTPADQLTKPILSEQSVLEPVAVTVTVTYQPSDKQSPHRVITDEEFSSGSIELFDHSRQTGQVPPHEVPAGAYDISARFKWFHDRKQTRHVSTGEVVVNGRVYSARGAITKGGDGDARSYCHLSLYLTYKLPGSPIPQPPRVSAPHTAMLFGNPVSIPIQGGNGESMVRCAVTFAGQTPQLVLEPAGVGTTQTSEDGLFVVNILSSNLIQVSRSE